MFIRYFAISTRRRKRLLSIVCLSALIGLAFYSINALIANNIKPENVNADHIIPESVHADHIIPESVHADHIKPESVHAQEIIADSDDVYNIIPKSVADDIIPKRVADVIIPKSVADDIILKSVADDIIPQSIHAYNIKSEIVSTALSGHERADFVRNMAKHAWQTYAKVALGSNEFKPISNRSSTQDMFGTGSSLGVFLIDSIDTLMIMNLNKEVDEAINWLRAGNFNPSNVSGYVNVFEVSIRILGGLLGAYSVSKNQNDKNLLLKSAKDIADRLLAAFDETSNIPYSLVNLQSGGKCFHSWSPRCIILSEAASIQLEMEYLSKISGDNKYSEQSRLSTRAILDRYNGNDYISIDGKNCRTHVSMGALGDSFYEYLLKLEILSKNTIIGYSQRFKAFQDSLKIVEARILRDNDPNLTYFGEDDGTFKNSMGHLACFSAGMYALAKMHRITDNDTELARYERLARNLTWTCRRSYLLGNGIGPESFQIHRDGHLSGASASYYILRPEYIESLFYLYRMTNDEMYRDWAWEVVLQIEKRCKVPGGYASLKNVFDSNNLKNDDQATFYIAETLKYLYILFNDDISLDKYVFSTEAHPFLIS